MEYDNDENTWHHSSTPKPESSCHHQIPKRSTSLGVVVLGLAVLSCLLGYCMLSETLPNESKTLRFVIVLFRHGARTPATSYNSSPYKNYQWPNGRGSLTNVGKLQLYELGKKFRSYYANFIPEEYTDTGVFVRSSDRSRCTMSAATFLAGLFPPTGRQIWNPDVAWQPIPVHSLPLDLDNIVAGTKSCVLHKKMYNEQLHLVDSDPKYADLFEYLSRQTNQSMRSVLPVDFLYSTLCCEQEAGLKLPEWTKNVFPNKMKEPFMQSLALLSYNMTLQRLQLGPLLGEVKQNLEDVVNRTIVERSLLVYSGHDVTLVGLWRALGHSELLAPEYGASVTIELHEDIDRDALFIKTFYRNNTKIEVPLELKLPFCDEPCTYNQFISHISKYIPEDWEAECGNP